MIKVGIIGGAGYTAGELIRILLNHSKVQISFVHSSSNAGNKLYAVHSDLLGDTEMSFTGGLQLSSVDVLFLCMGHGKSKAFFESEDVPENVKIIDLSHDFRIKAEGNDFVYGLPEINRESIKNANHIANPGCFATGIQMALLPLAANKLIKGDVHINAITGSTGAGQSPSATTHFSWRNNNLSAYKIFQHQHEGEIIQSLVQLQEDFSSGFYFIPVRGNHTRGIFATAYTKFDAGLEEAVAMYKDFYKNHPFVFVSETNPGLKQVVNTNKVIVYLEKHGDNLVVISVSDNLIKGASGQAVQNMNLMFGLDETEGLNLKSISF